MSERCYIVLATLEKLREAVKEVFENPSYRTADRKVQVKIQEKDWLEYAADIAEATLR